MTRARVLLVDDDASIRRFVALALEELDVDLVEVPGVAASHIAAGEPTLTPDKLAAIERHFGGDRGLFIAFRASCRAQFAADLHAGDAAVAAGDAAALRRLAHSLNSVLATLGHPAPGATARTLEDAAAATDWAAAAPLWRQLRAHLAGEH